MMTGRTWRLGVRIALVVALTLGAGQAARAFGCPEGSSANFLGMCMPNIGGDAGRIANEARAQALGHALEVWINGSYSTAQSGARPIPPQIREQLRGYILESVMDRASYKVGDNGFLNAAFAAQHYGDAFGGEVRATTLVNVIVFRDQAGADDPALWAHELTHVKQFRDIGTHSFAISYVRNAGSEEEEAYRVGDGYQAWSNAHHGGAPLPPLLDPPPPPRPPSNIVPGIAPGRGNAAFEPGLRMVFNCTVSDGWCPLPYPKSFGSGCTCNGPNGPVNGVAF